MPIEPNIFHAYDIRGKYPEEINEEVAEKIGRAATDFFSKKYKKTQPEIVVCQDVRMTSARLKDALTRALMAQGATAQDLGIGTTPFFNFALNRLKVDGGIMVTASHLAPEFNGFKIKARRARPISMGSGLEKIQKLATEGKFKSVAAGGKIIAVPDMREEYLRFLARGVKIGKLRVVIDAAGGSTAYFLPMLLDKFPQIIYKPLFFEPDGSFHKHPANPLEKDAQKFIREELQKGNFNLGAVFDGDGDRVAFFDEKGNTIRPEFIFALFAEEELEKRPGGTFVMPLNTSRAVREFIKAKGGKIKIVRVGYIAMKEAMRSSRASLGAEYSGHFYFRKMFSLESGLMACLKLAELVSKTPRPLSQMVQPFETYITSGELNFAVVNKNKALEKVKNFYPKGNTSFLDGVSVEYDDWWCNVRPSNTEEVLRLVLEAKDQELFDEKLKEIKRLISG